MKINLIIFVLLGFSAIVFAQKSPDYDFRTTPVSNSKVKGTSGDYYRVSFNILGIKNALQRKALERYFNANPNFKQVRINSINEFHGFVKKTMHAKDVRPLLLSQGVDFKFDRYKFKGCYLKEVQQQQKSRMTK